MRLDQFVAKLPRNASSPTIVIDQGNSLEVQVEPPPGYVKPKFTVKDRPVGSAVVLVEAAGAVGKSAAAAALAAELNWPLVRAERARVGSHALSGLIQDALGFTGTYIQQIAVGQAGVVVDSLDEAHFKVGTDNFLAFLTNVASVSGAASLRGEAGPSVLLLSRADTAEYVRLFFADQNLSLAQVQIDFFDRTGANEYIESYLRKRYLSTHRAEYNVALAWPKPFQQMRDKRMQQIGAVMLGSKENLSERWNDVDDFLGYAPVLTVIAESLAVSNPSAERNILEASDSTLLLRDIVKSILQREHLKFRQIIEPKLIAQTPADSPSELVATDLYGPEEQQIRLLSAVTGNPLNVELPVTLPNTLRPVYNEAAGQFLKDHPFVRGDQFASQVFSDYVLAGMAGSTSARAALSRPPSTSVQGVGSFFARFIHALGNGELEEGLIQSVSQSWLQESEVYGSTDFEVSFEGAGGSGRLRCVRTETSGEVTELEYVIAELSPVLVLQEPLSYMTIVTDQCISLTGSNGVLQVGPKVIVVCDELEIVADILRVESTPNWNFSFGVSASRIVANRLTKIEGLTRSIRFYCEDLPPLLTPYRSVLAVDNKRISYKRYVDLRSILTAFRGTTRDYLAASADKIDQAVVRENPHRKNILQFLQDNGVVVRHQTQYRLSLSSLGSYGFSLRDLKSGPNDAVLSFLIQCGCES